MHYQIHKDADGKWYVGTIAADGEVLAYSPYDSWAQAIDELKFQMYINGDAPCS